MVRYVMYIIEIPGVRGMYKQEIRIKIKDLG